MPELSIIIINYKNQELILSCVHSIVKNEGELDFELIVVDNNSEDESKKELIKIFPNLKWIQTGYNSGFGRANNAGIKAATGKKLLLLNSDIIVQKPKTISSCLDYLNGLDDSKNTILGTRLVGKDESYQETLRLEFPGLAREVRANAFYILIVDRWLKKSFKGKELQKEAHYRSGEVAWINGAFLLCDRATILDKQLFFDEDFFLYGEDTEWCWRAMKSGMKFHHWHEQQLIHLGSASSDNQKAKVQQVMASDWLYLRKTRGFWYTALTLFVIFKNQILDASLHFFARLRRKPLSEAVLLQKKYRKWILEILKKYWIQVLFKSNHSDEKTFKINCYD